MPGVVARLVGRPGGGSLGLCLAMRVPLPCEAWPRRIDFGSAHAHMSMSRTRDGEDMEECNELMHEISAQFYSMCVSVESDTVDSVR